MFKTRKILAFLSVFVLMISMQAFVLTASAEDSDWNVLEDFNADGKTVSDYAVDSLAGISLVDDGNSGKALRFAFGDTWGVRCVKLGAIESYPGSKWYKFDLKGPQTGSLSDGYFQFGPGLDDAAGTKTLAWPGEGGTPSDKTGYVFIRSKGEAVWTKIADKNIRIANDFDGEVMMCIANLCLKGGSYTATPLSFNGWMTDRTVFALLDASESVTMDNFCVSDRDMTPSSYYIEMQEFNIAGIAEGVAGTGTYAFAQARGDRAVKLTSTSADAMSQEIKFNGNSGVSVEGAPYLEFYIEGPGGTAHDGWFQILPVLHSGTKWLGMSNPDKVDYDDDKTGMVYIKPDGSDVFTRYTCGELLKLDNDFKGIIRYEISRFNSAAHEYTDQRLDAVLNSDTSYISFVESGKSVVLDTYRAVRTTMVKGVDYVIDGERAAGDESSVVLQDFNSASNVASIGNFEATLPSLIANSGGQALKLLSGGLTISTGVFFNHQNLTGAKYLEISVIGPEAGKASSGSFEWTPAIQTADGYHRMAGAGDNGVTNTTKLGVMFYQPKGSTEWFELNGSSKFNIDRNFEGKLRFPIECYLFNGVTSTVETTKKWSYSIAATDYIAGLKKDDFVVVDDYTAIYKAHASKLSESSTATMSAKGIDPNNPGTGSPLPMIQLVIAVAAAFVFLTFSAVTKRRSTH